MNEQEFLAQAHAAYMQYTHEMQRQAMHAASQHQVGTPPGRDQQKAQIEARIQAARTALVDIARRLADAMHPQDEFSSPEFWRPYWDLLRTEPPRGRNRGWFLGEFEWITRERQDSGLEHRHSLRTFVIADGRIVPEPPRSGLVMAPAALHVYGDHARRPDFWDSLVAAASAVAAQAGILVAGALDDEIARFKQTTADIQRDAQASGDWSEAARRLSEAMSTCAPRLGVDHPDLLMAQAGLAAYLGHAGDWPVAIRVQREVVDADIRVFGAEHPETLMNRLQLAYLISEGGDPLEAIRLNQEVIVAQTRILGAEHVDTLQSRHTLACLFAYHVGLPDAISVMREVVVARRRVLGVDHEDTQNSSSWLADFERTASAN